MIWTTLLRILIIDDHTTIRETSSFHFNFTEEIENWNDSQKQQKKIKEVWYWNNRSTINDPKKNVKPMVICYTMGLGVRNYTIDGLQLSTIIELGAI